MRNILVLVAAFTLSSTSTMSIMACNPSSDRGTTNVFDWSDAFKDTGTTTDNFFDFLLNNPDSGWGSKLYKDINEYVNLSILKNDPKYTNDYNSALISAKSEVENQINSLRAKFGRSWEKEWKKVLGDNDINAYIDSILKKTAVTIIQRSYVTQNYEDYKYYNQNEINIWLKDIWEQVNINNPGHPFDTVAEYVNGKLGEDKGKYADKVWIVAKANNINADLSTYTELNAAIKLAHTWNDVGIGVLVAKTTDDKNDNKYETDSYNSIDGLLSDNQSKIAKVMLKNQESIWTRQIVIPFNSTAKPLQEKIKLEQFSQNVTEINDVLKNIKANGFNQTFSEKNKGATTDLAKTGDLGLLNIADSKDKTPFYYYLYRYVTSTQGVGSQVSSSIQPYSLRQFSEEYPNLNNLLPLIDRENVTTATAGGTSQFNDLVYMEDTDGTTLLPSATKNNGPGVGIFIDANGIHFIQTPGITYQQKDKPEPTKSTFDIIKDFKNHKGDFKWADFASLAERPGGLASTPYLDYLQTDYLLQKHTLGTTPTFDLNSALTKFTADGDVNSPNWWDYNLYFNKNADLIHWNLQGMTGSKPSGNDEKINTFVQKMQGWFTKTLAKRWNNKQGIYVNSDFLQNVIDTNKTWDGYTIDAPNARLDMNISDYLNAIGKQTLWWYDPSIIRS